MMRVVWTEVADADFREALSYIRDRSPAGALSISAAIHKTARQISMFPRAGVYDADLGSLERLVVGTRFVIVYHIDQRRNRIEVLGLVHAARHPLSKRISKKWLR